MVNPYYGNNLYSGLAGNTHQPLQQIWIINMQAKRIGTELVPYIIYHDANGSSHTVYPFSAVFKSAWQEKLIFELPDGQTLKKSSSLTLKAKIRVHSGISICILWQAIGKQQTWDGCTGAWIGCKWTHIHSGPLATPLARELKSW